MRGRVLTAAGVVMMLAGLAFTTSGCKFYYHIVAKDKVNLGSRAYNAGRYQDAEKLFREAIDTVDPEPYKIAMAFYAAAISAQFLPGSTDDKNKAMAERAIAAYKDLLRVDPNDPDAHAFIAHLYEGLGESEQQVAWLKKLAEIPDLDKERRMQTYYSVGVIKWNESYQLTTRWIDNRQGPVNALDPMYSVYLRKDFPPDERKKALESTQMGLEYVNKAIAIDPENPNPYSYLGLLYREQAKLTEVLPDKKKFAQMNQDAILKFQELNRKAEEKAAQQAATSTPAKP